ncbi:DUF4367 domain-containing protein [Paenibacillus sp. MER 180]|uniref:DUF4367 domain-containing protein n=1 Tax=Paenibacillus sp. MER 180 TaxID=2939570 RepID=UPI00203A4F5E|nr:DUF4367 domain-containing protein [Paenibacillus sp. MER 180]MCM3290436.1 DUF4367 domain-containing protein [Paenibacillus sp. MER 180]
MKSKSFLITMCAVLAMSMSISQVVTAKEASAAKGASTKKKESQKKEDAKQNGELTIKDGELYATYTSKDNSINFSFRTITGETYEEFLKQAVQYKAPKFTEPASLPEGYGFIKSEITPPYPDSFSEAYRVLLDQLKKEAKGKKEYQKKLNWKEAGEAGVMYAKGSDFIFLTVTRMQPLTIEKSPAAPVGGKLEKVKVNGLDAVYTTGSNALYSNVLMWQVKEKKLEYRISTNKQSPLTKEELIQIAESWNAAN